MQNRAMHLVNQVPGMHVALLFWTCQVSSSHTSNPYMKQQQHSSTFEAPRYFFMTISADICLVCTFVLQAYQLVQSTSYTPLLRIQSSGRPSGMSDLEVSSLCLVASSKHREELDVGCWQTWLHWTSPGRPWVRAHPSCASLPPFLVCCLGLLAWQTSFAQAGQEAAVPFVLSPWACLVFA